MISSPKEGIREYTSREEKHEATGRKETMQSQNKQQQ